MAVFVMVVSAAADLVKIDVGVLVCVLALIGTGCVTVPEALGSINGRVMLAIVFAFGLSEALDNNHTCVAGFIARHVSTRRHSQPRFDSTVMKCPLTISHEMFNVHEMFT